MGQLQQIILQLVVVFLCITAAFTWYGVAVSNGGYSTANIPLNNSAALYYNQTYQFQSQFLNSTKAATQTSSTTDAATGLASLSSAGAQAITLTFTSLGQMVDVISVAQITLAGFGVPTYFFSFAILFISTLMAMIIFAAIYKWWI